MPSFTRHVFYASSLVTGPSSAVVRIRFSKTDDGAPLVSFLRHASPSARLDDDVVAAAVTSAVRQANEECGTDYAVAEIQYSADNDGKCHLISRAAYLVVKRLVEAGEDGYPDPASA